MDPCGTSHIIFFGLDSCPFIRHCWTLLFRYDSNHLSWFPVTPKKLRILSIRISWFMESKAFLTSRKIGTRRVHVSAKKLDSHFVFSWKELNNNNNNNNNNEIYCSISIENMALHLQYLQYKLGIKSIKSYIYIYRLFIQNSD
jgi:hypothetical protein